MKNLLACGALASLLILTSCGKGSAPDGETCTTCSEQSLNAPVGPQPAPEPVDDYDAGSANPPRATLAFPAFSSKWGLKKALFDRAMQYYLDQKSNIANPRYFTIVDFSLSANKKRLFLFDLSNGTVEMHAVAAGTNSDPDNDGMATKFSNTEGSKMSSLGFYRTLQTYNGTHGLSLRLDGLENTNDNALSRAIVMHPADYVSDATPHAGRSWGCPAVDPKVSASLIAKVKNGSILLIGR
jgi:hypothetical protein